MKTLSRILIACTIATAIQEVRPGAEWVLNGDRYAGLTWIDKVQTKPTSSEIDTAMVACQSRETQEKLARDQAKLDLNNTSKTDTERINALIKYLGLNTSTTSLTGRN